MGSRNECLVYPTELMTKGKKSTVKWFDLFTLRIFRVPTKSNGLCEFES